jgi:hypothetical protein
MFKFLIATGDNVRVLARQYWQVKKLHANYAGPAVARNNDFKKQKYL